MGSGFGDWLAAQMKRCGFTSNVELEQATGIGNTTISRWRNGSMAPSVDQLRKLEEPLQVSLLELLVRAGVLSPAEAKVSSKALEESPTVISTVADAIRHDVDLLEEARQHLLNQYELLRRLAPAEPSAPTGKKAQRRIRSSPGDPDQRLRAVARGGDPKDREEVRRLARRAREEHDKSKE